jgi:hypothetical protein
MQIMWGGGMSELSEDKPYTKAELDQQAIWADEFDKWWIEEGQYHRAGGNDYCRTFAWWAWLSREQSKQSEINGIQEEHAELLAFNEKLDRERNGYRKDARKYARKIQMIADLLRSPTDKEMTLQAIKTVIDQVGEHG